MFSKVALDELPPYREGNYRIELLKDEKKLPTSPLYYISLEYLEVLREYLRENLYKGFII